MFPAPIRAACAQVWLVPTSVRALRTLERATAAWRGGGEAQEAACGGGKVAIPAILTRLPDPGHAVRLQDCNVSTFGRALHRPDQVQAAWRAVARHWWQFAAVAKSRFFTSLHGGHVVWSNCDFRVLSGPGELYYVPIVCTNTSRRPAELFPDLHESSRSDFGLSAQGTTS